MSEERDAYHAYLLRLWRARCRGRWQWRASLESPRTGERQLFGDLPQLCAFLTERCDGQDEGIRRRGGTETWKDNQKEMKGDGDEAGR